jgi:ribosomal protein S18 acetylase RimI-like enzyme
VIETYKISHKKQVSPYLDEEDKKMFENKFFIKFVYKDKSGVKGWALLQPSKDRLLLNWIIVLKEYREKGIGTKILDYIKKYAKRKKFRGISVNTGSKTFWARKFYEKNNFKKVGSVKNYYKFDKKQIFYWYEIK